jgi:2'-5' RNA ligase
VGPFELRAGGFGTFGSGRTVRVLWIGVGGETDRLRALAGRVEDATEPLGFPREKRPFAAHLTLARVRDDADRVTRERLHAALQPFLSKESAAPAIPSLRADRVSLMQSTLQRGGAVYRAVEVVQLQGARS